MSALPALLQRAPEPEAGDIMSGEWLSAPETAKRLNLHISTVYRHLHEGTLPCRSMRIGRLWRIQTEDVESLKATLRQLLRDADPSAGAAVLTALIESDDDG